MSYLPYAIVVNGVVTACYVRESGPINSNDVSLAQREKDGKTLNIVGWSYDGVDFVDERLPPEERPEDFIGDEKAKIVINDLLSKVKDLETRLAALETARVGKT